MSQLDDAGYLEISVEWVQAQEVSGDSPDGADRNPPSPFSPTGHSHTHTHAHR